MAKITVDKKRKILENIYDEQMNRQARKIKKGTYTGAKAQVDVMKITAVHSKLNKFR